MPDNVPQLRERRFEARHCYILILKYTKHVPNGPDVPRVYYALRDRDPVLLQVPDLLEQYFAGHLPGTLAMPGEVNAGEGGRA